MISPEASLPLYEDMLDMLADLVRQLGGPKKVGPLLRGSMPIEAAAQWIRDCLNRERRERLDPEQLLHILRLAREAGIHSGKFWLDAELGYEQGKPVNPRDEVADLQRRYIETVHLARDIADRMERLARSPIQIATSR
jgi:hypothetical protein